MTLAFTLAWWHLGVASVALGILIFTTAPKRWYSFMGWPQQEFTPQHFVGAVLLLLGVVYLALGGIARCLP